MSSPSAARRQDRHAFAFDGPSGIALVAVLAVALFTIGFLVWPVLNPGPGTSDTAPPTASVSPTVQPSVTLAPSPTSEPTPTAAPTSTPVARWTGLSWSDPVTPSFFVHLDDLLPWGDGYVAVGRLPVGAGLTQAGFLTSPDGLNWTVTYQFDPVGDRYPQHLVASGDTLFAFSPRALDDVEIVLPSGSYSGPLVWSSTDGAAWTLVDSPSWEEGWREARQHVGALPAGWVTTQYDIETGFVDAARGPAGIIAIGNSFADDGLGLAPILLHSFDGLTWSRSILPNDSPSAILNSIAAVDGGYVVVGAVDVGSDPRTAVPAAWYSADGLTWTRATVEDDPDFVASGEFGPLAAGTDGLVTCFNSRSMGAGGWRYMDPWTSTDGLTWTAARVGDLEHPRYACGWMASDGVRIVALSGRTSPTGLPWPGVTGAWVSADGASWMPMTVSEVMTDMLERYWVVPDGVIYAGEQAFWFGTAIER